MTVEDLKKYCLSKKAAKEEYPFGPEVIVIKVCGKMFALISNKEGEVNISLKCEPLLADSLRQEYSYIIPGYHLNKRHWNTVIIEDYIIKEHLYWMIDNSYDLVFNSLPKKLREEASL